MKHLRRILAVTLTVTLVIGMLFLPAYAKNDKNKASSRQYRCIVTDAF